MWITATGSENCRHVLREFDLNRPLDWKVVTSLYREKREISHLLESVILLKAGLFGALTY